MALQVRKKDRESSQNLAHRFSRTVRQAGVLLEVRSRQHTKRAKSELAKKRSAVRRVKLNVERRKQEKLSKPK